MDPDYWRARWTQGRTGWHQGQPNEHLVAHFEALGSPRRVLVPLAGKSVDLAYLAGRGASVVGVELVEEAARAFFEEQGFAAQRTVDGPLARWEGGAIEIVVGDFFDLTRAEIGSFDAFYDRAALVALPHELRRRYVAHVLSLLEPGARGLVVTFEHDAPPHEPPFSVDADEIRDLFERARVTSLTSVDVTASSSLTPRGANFVRERAWLIEMPT